MSLSFLIGKSIIPITDVVQAEESVLKVKNPKIEMWQDERTTSISQVALIDSGETLYLSGEKRVYSFSASLGTSTCLQAFFYNDSKETCLLHTNRDFQINWSQIFFCFKDKKLKFNLVGAHYANDPTAQSNPKSFPNTHIFFDSLINFLKDHQTISVTLENQMVLTDNVTLGKDRRGGIDYKRYDPKLRNPGFDVCGKVFDMTIVSKQLKSYPLAENLRMIRSHEGEHRAMFAREFKCAIAPSEVLVLTENQTPQEIIQQSYIHQAVIDFTRYLHESGKILAYCDAVCQYLNKGNPDEPLAISYTHELQEFFEAVLSFGTSQDLAELKIRLRKHPLGPFSLNVLSCQYTNSYADRMPKLTEKILAQVSLIKRQLIGYERNSH